ncbi:ornithine cyclodeaminase family protein [Variovorax sp. OV329]|uniref:ornithine cyclodeaminase family protein n=1 Tax=Variovorax sp. OV329 TaxID=1882825 RepID=UPI0008EEF869|nr:ornithine cyclodeaminase family protein [Variovorax sp. OV329]SFM75803.1 ornithine cyclodeaminase [Variovorax sp. OV329]
MKIFDAATTRAALDFDRLLPALHAAFAGQVCVPARHVHEVKMGADEGTVLIMPAWSEDGFLGIKTVNIFPGNGARGLPGLHASYVLYDARTGVPLAMMDGDEITSRRTAAAAALGASFLARTDARRLLVLGTGRVARLLPAAMRQVRPGIDAVTVWNHRPEGAQALAAQWRAQGLDARAADDLEDAVRHADIVSCATLSTAPLVRGEWLQPGSHLDLIGSFTPQMREADPACFGDGARSFVDTGEALKKSGDLLDAMAAGHLREDEVQATLFQLCRGERQGRASDAERTVFKAVGNALEDLAAATLVWRSSLDT